MKFTRKVFPSQQALERKVFLTCQVAVMNFNYILIAFASRGTPPLAHKLKSARKDCQFAPLANDGLIYTTDVEMWSNSVGEFSKTFCPRCSDITQSIRQAENDNGYCVIALTHLVEFDPPGTPDVHLPLVHWQQIAEEADGARLTEAGFDVVDQWTGLSALVNIGYSVEDLVVLQNTSLHVNQFGLFDTEEDAIEFAGFATAKAPEHAPFIPLKTLVRIPNR